VAVASVDREMSRTGEHDCASAPLSAARSESLSRSQLELLGAAEVGAGASGGVSDEAANEREGGEREVLENAP
jgi:hypothetical protein